MEILSVLKEMLLEGSMTKALYRACINSFKDIEGYINDNDLDADTEALTEAIVEVLGIDEEDFVTYSKRNRNDEMAEEGEGRYYGYSDELPDAVAV